MQVQWVPKKKVTWLGRVGLGEVPELVIKAKTLLFTWKNLYGNVPVPDYGTLQDLTGYWAQRDQTMMDAFVDYWTALGGQPVTFKQAPEDTPTSGQVAALEAWSKTVLQPLPFPGGGGSPTSPNLPGFPPQIPGLPPVPVDTATCVQACLATAGVTSASPNYLFAVVNCVGQCNQNKGLVQPANNTRVAPNLPPPTDTSSSALPWIIGGAAVLGLGALALMSPKMQENAYLGVGVSAGLGKPRRRRKRRR